MSFFMRSLLRTVPLIGALLISATPVQASKAFREITKPCNSLEEIRNACDAMAIHFSAVAHFTYLCSYELDTGETPENLTKKPRLHAKTESGAQTAIVAFNTAIEKVKKDYPNCSVKPFP